MSRLKAISRLKATFSDPARRPRLIIWLGMATIALVILAGGSVVGTSTQWFCTEPCHMVHYDNTLAYNAGSHVKVSCIACHEPLNGSPLTFILMKIEVAPDLIPTVLGTFHLPMNENHSVSFAMPEEQCTQCHTMANREINPSPGIIMDHEAHAAEGVTCVSCHNRVAHPEDDVEYVLEGDKKHEDWMGMDACFRCHSLEAGAIAPGACAACHPADFDLVPPSHDASGWYAEYGESGGHAAAASEEASRVAAAVTWAEGLHELEENETLDMGYEQTVNTCYTCHAKQFCTDCHGVEMPHPAEFATDHGDAGRSNPESCARCHARSEAEAEGTNFCNACHHPQGTPDRPWIEQHFDAVESEGASSCFECHDPKYCAVCHVSGPEEAARYVREQAGK